MRLGDDPVHLAAREQVAVVVAVEPLDRVPAGAAVAMAGRAVASSITTRPGERRRAHPAPQG